MAKLLHQVDVYIPVNEKKNKLVCAYAKVDTTYLYTKELSCKNRQINEPSGSEECRRLYRELGYQWSVKSAMTNLLSPLYTYHFLVTICMSFLSFVFRYMYVVFAGN